MRKIASSGNTDCTWAFSSRALARSVPNGFSITIRARSDSPASPRVVTTSRAAAGGMLR